MIKKVEDPHTNTHPIAQVRCTIRSLSFELMQAGASHLVALLEINNTIPLDNGEISRCKSTFYMVNKEYMCRVSNSFK